MNGMLLAAGRGDRMEPLSSVIAKPVLDVLGRPLLASALAHLERAGCEPLVVNTHRHPGQVEAAVRAVAAPRTVLAMSPEPGLLGSCGGVAGARRFFGPGPVLVGNGDVWADLDLTPLLQPWAPDEVVLATVPHPDPDRWSSVLVDRDGRVSAIVPRGGAKQGVAYLFTGFQWLGEAVVAALPSPPGEMAPVWDALRRAGRLRAVVVPGQWREAGTPRSYRDLVCGLLGNETWVHPAAIVAPDAIIRNAAVGAGCRVGAAALVEGSVLTAGATVGAGAVVRGSVLAGEVYAPADAVRDEVVQVPGSVTPL